MRVTHLIAIIGCVAAVASLWYVIAPPRSPQAYRERALRSVESLRSQVQTARLWTRAERRGRVMREAATVGLQEAERDARATASGFLAYDPPQGLVGLRARVARASAAVDEILADVRIAAHDEAWDDVADLAGRLAPLAARLQQLAQDARP